jgi:phosphoribosyl-ATP pyrophosphohydrolase/phosphoribosyl-AMP cyclohydrolase
MGIKLWSGGARLVLPKKHQQRELPWFQGETTLEKLQQVIALRNHERPEGSYTTHLFENGVEKILKKTGEEAVEMLLARTDGELLYESADFLYHLFVLLEAKGLDYRDILQELEKRMK